MILGISLIAFAVILAILLVAGLVQVPTVHYGVHKRFGRRLRKDPLKEGLHFVFPFIDEVDLYRYQLDPERLEGQVFSSDRLEVMLQGSVQWRPDSSDIPRKPDDLRPPVNLLRDRFAETSEEAIREGLIDAIKGELGSIAGSKKGDVFIQHRRELDLLINSILRLETAPHLSVPGGSGWKIPGDPPSNGDPCEVHANPDQATHAQGKEEIPPKKRIEFYALNAGKVREMLHNESKERDSRSVIEERYGVDIEVFALSDVDFSPKTKQALELARQAEAEMSAAATRQERKKAIMEYLRDAFPNMSPRDMSNAAESVMGISDRQIISIEGEGGNIPVINISRGGK